MDLRVGVNTRVTSRWGMGMRTLGGGLCLLLGLGILSPVPALAANSDTSGPRKAAPPGVYGPSVGVPLSGVALFWDQDPGSPWVDGVLEPIRAHLTAQGVSVTVFPSTAMGTADLSPFTKVITTSVQPVSFWDGLAANKSRFEAYVSGGGILELHLASFTSETNTGKVFPGGFVVKHDGNNYNRVNVEDPFHRILRQPNRVMAEELQNWEFSAHGYFSTVPAGANPIVREAETGDGNVVTAELFLGDGKILATVQPVEWDLASARYRENMVLFRPHAQVEVSLALAGCAESPSSRSRSPLVGRSPQVVDPVPLPVCTPGDVLTALATVSNTGLTAFTVEIKGGVRLPDGTPINLLPSRHIEMAIPPGITGPLPVLEVPIPPELPEGEYKAEAALLTPALGRELSRAEVTVTVGVTMSLHGSREGNR